MAQVLQNQVPQFLKKVDFNFFCIFTNCKAILISNKINVY